MAVSRSPAPRHWLGGAVAGPWGSAVDVVGVGPGNAMYVVEVKASRADFARDNHTEADIDRLRKRQGADCLLLSALGACFAFIRLLRPRGPVVKLVPVHLAAVDQILNLVHVADAGDGRVGGMPGEPGQVAGVADGAASIALVRRV